MKIFSLIFLGLIILSPSLQAQGQAGLVLVDSASQEPIEGGVVHFKDGEKIKTVFSNFKGLAKSPFQKTVEFTVTRIGYRPKMGALEPGEHKKVLLQNTGEAMDEVIITGQYGETEASDNLYLTQVIDQEQITAQGANTLRDVLMTQNTIRVGQDGALGASNMTMMGMGGEQVKVLIDGVPVVGRAGSSFDLSQINLEHVERIEIVQGPMAVKYGADALAGVINIIMKKSFTGQPELTLQTQIATVDNQLSEHEGRHSLGLHYRQPLKFQLFSEQEQWSTQAQLTRNFFGGFRGINTLERARSWYPKEQYTGRIGLGVSTSRFSLEYTLQVLSETLLDRGEPDSIITLDQINNTRTRSYNANTNYYHTYRFLHTLQAQWEVKEGVSLQLIEGFTDYTRIAERYVTNLSTLSEDLDEKDNTYYGASLTRIILQDTRSKMVGYETGLEINHEWGGGVRIAESDPLTNVALFATSEMRPAFIEGLTLKPGVRFTYNSQYRLSDRAMVFGVLPALPSLLVKYNLPWNLSVKGQWARGFRAPSLRELNYEFIDANHYLIGNPDLEAEFSNYYAATLQYREEFDNSMVEAELTAFGNRMRDRITLVQGFNDPNNPSDDNIVTYSNIESFRSQGLNSSLGFRYKRYVQAKVGVAFVGIKQANSATDLRGQDYFYQPEYNCSLQLREPRSKFTWSVFGKYSAPFQQNRIDENGNLTLVENEGFAIVDASISRPCFQDRLEVIFGANNLTNTTFVQAGVQTGAHSAGGNASPISFGRSYFLTLKWKIVS